MIFGLLGESGAILGTPKGTCWGQNLKLLNFDPRKQVRGVFASLGFLKFVGVLHKNQQIMVK